MTAADPIHTEKSLLDFRLSRRTVLLSAGLGVVGAVGLAGPASAAANYSAVPRLPGEVSRTSTRYTTLGNPYEQIDVSTGGDKARLFVPWSSPPSKPRVRVAWFYHSNWADRTSMNSAFQYPAALLVDRGYVSVCPDFGGTLWTNQTAISHQTRWAAWMSGTFDVAEAFSRANSGGGLLMCWAYGKNLIPKMRGIYLCNAAYDMTDVYTRDPRTWPAYGYSKTTMQKTDPARLPVSSWAGKRIRVCVSEEDEICPPAKHGIALINKAAPVAASTSALWHDMGHDNPGKAHTDMIAAFESWS